MTSSLRRAWRALHRFTGVVLGVVCLLTAAFPIPASSATAPTIVSVDVTGNVHVPTATIMSVIQAKPGEPYDPKVVQGDLERIFALGYFSDQAAPLIRPRPNGVAITYRVVENPVVSKISFTGNSHVSTDTLLALMDTSVGQVLNSNTLRSDFLKINSYYDRIGYGGQLPSHVKDVNISPAGALTVTIEEGLTITGVEIGGDPLLKPAIILPVLAAKPGVEYSDELRNQDEQAVQKLYDKLDLALGYFDGGIDPATINEKAGTAEVKYDIYVARVGLVQITGNTKTKDQVVRRLLYLKPGMIITKSALERDRENLSNTGFFSKVDLIPKGSPDPKAHPGWVTLDWNVTEQKTASASVGFGYSGGLTGQGLYGTLGYQDTNLSGTGNGVSVQLEKGAFTSVAQASVTIPYVGHTPESQKYSFGGTIFTNSNRYYYPIYTTAGSNALAPAPGATQAPIPVTLLQSGSSQEVNGVVSTSSAKATGIGLTVGRRLTPYFTASVGTNIETVSNSTTVPSPYYFQSAAPNVLVGPNTTNPFSNLSSTGTFGINAPSIADINTGQPYRLNELTFGLGSNPQTTLDDVFNPRRGGTISLSETLSNPALMSNFSFTETQLDLTKFLPVLSDATLGFHAQGRTSTGTIPPSALYTFSDQQLRGYNSVFYGTDTVLGQIELRQPLTPDRKFGVALFADEGGFVVRGAAPLVNPYTNRTVGYPGDWQFQGDYGFGLRLDLPQLGIHTVRIDFARGSNGFHTSFGIGQSF